MGEIVKHTPGPWRVAAPPDKVCTDYGDDSDFTKNGLAKTVVVCEHRSWMAEGEEFANAAFIVKAVNCHNELLEALREMVEAYDGFPTDMSRDERECCRIAFGKAEAAIAKAEGRP